MDSFSTRKSFNSRRKKSVSSVTDGILQEFSPDPKKTESILKMQFPPDKETMHSFLGLVNFLNRYTRKLAELCSPLRKLILKDSHYSPGDPEHAAFNAIKAEIQEEK